MSDLNAGILAEKLGIGPERVEKALSEMGVPYSAPPAEPTEQVSITGYLGGEKIGLFDDAKFKALAAKQGIAIDYRKAGSLAMMDADRKGMDYMFPSSRAAVEYGNAKGVKAPQSDIVFNSPIVLYTHKAVADGLVNGGLVTKDNSGAYHMCLIWP